MFKSLFHASDFILVKSERFLGGPVPKWFLMYVFPLVWLYETIPTIFVDYLIINLSFFVNLNKYRMSASWALWCVNVGSTGDQLSSFPM